MDASSLVGAFVCDYKDENRNGTIIEVIKDTLVLRVRWEDNSITNTCYRHVIFQPNKEQIEERLREIHAQWDTGTKKKRLAVPQEDYIVPTIDHSGRRKRRNDYLNGSP